MNFPFQPTEDVGELPETARAALKEFPRIEPRVDFNRAVLQSLDTEKMRRQATLIGRIEEFLGLGIWQFAGSSALGALLPAVILGSMLCSQAKPSTERSLPEPPPDPLNLNYYGPLYAREIFQNQVRASASQPLPVAPLRTGELCPDSKPPLV